jgi:hypothetical protein
LLCVYPTTITPTGAHCWRRRPLPARPTAVKHVRGRGRGRSPGRGGAMETPVGCRWLGRRAQTYKKDQHLRTATASRSLPPGQPAETGPGESPLVRAHRAAALYISREPTGPRVPAAGSAEAGRAPASRPRCVCPSQIQRRCAVAVVVRARSGGGRSCPCAVRVVGLRLCRDRVKAAGVRIAYCETSHVTSC